MRILFFSDYFPPETSAPATRVFERACYWAKWGHDVTFITSAPNFPQGKVYPGYSNKWHQVEIMNGIRVVRVKTFMARNEGVMLRILDFLSYMCSAFVAGLFEKKPDLIVATSPQFFTAVGGWALSVVRSVPFIFELGDLWPASITAVGAMKENLFLRLMGKVELFLYHRSAAVVALTHAFKLDLVRRGIPEEKIAVVINGVDLPRYAPQPRDPSLAAAHGLSDKFVLGYIGTHGMSHALENVLAAAQLLRNEKNVRFLFVGDGAAKASLEREADRMSLSNVIFVPQQPKEKIPHFWSLCDVALIHLKNTPVFETVIPSKIFEAMGMGLPLLIAAPAGEASRIILSEKAGLHVPAEDPGALANAVLTMRNSPDMCLEFAQRSHDAAPRYSRERQATDMLAVLERVVSCTKA